MSLVAHCVSLFFILNALGNIPVFIGLLTKFDVKRQRYIIFREMIIALITLLLFGFFGDDVLRILGISQPVIGVAGGILLLIIALGMIFPRTPDHRDVSRTEPFVVPLAIPLVAGPGAIATVMIYADQMLNPWWLAVVIFAAWIPTLIILMLSSYIKHFLGRRGLTACQRLGGMLISLIAVQMMVSGGTSLLQQALHVPKDAPAASD